MHSSTFATLALVAAAPMALAQQSSVTSAPAMKPMATPSRPAITMEWKSEPAAALAVSTSTTKNASATMKPGMTMSGGSVMSMPSGMAKSGKSGASATGTAMAGMSMKGAANQLVVERGIQGGQLLVALGFGGWLLA